MFTTDRNLFNKSLKQTKRQRPRTTPYTLPDTHQQRPAFTNKSAHNMYNKYQNAGGFDEGKYSLKSDCYVNSPQYYPGNKVFLNATHGQGFTAVESSDAMILQDKNVANRDVEKTSIPERRINKPKGQDSAKSSMSVPSTSKWAKFVSSTTPSDSSSDEEDNQEQLNEILRIQRQKTAAFPSNRDGLSAAEDIPTLMSNNLASGMRQSALCMPNRDSILASCMSNNPASGFSIDANEAFHGKMMASVDKPQPLQTGANVQKENRNLFSIDSDEDLDDILATM